jgi:hypothetical protein
MTHQILVLIALFILVITVSHVVKKIEHFGRRSACSRQHAGVPNTQPPASGAQPPASGAQPPASGTGKVIVMDTTVNVNVCQVIASPAPASLS